MKKKKQRIALFILLAGIIAAIALFTSYTNVIRVFLFYDGPEGTRSYAFVLDGKGVLSCNAGHAFTSFGPFHFISAAQDAGEIALSTEASERITNLAEAINLQGKDYPQNFELGGWNIVLDYKGKSHTSGYESKESEDLIALMDEIKSLSPLQIDFGF